MKAERIDSIRELNSFLYQENVAFFGAGYASDHIIRYAKDHGFCIKEILVSSIEGNPKSILGIPVVLIDDISTEKENLNLLVCLTEKYHTEISAMLEEYEKFTQIRFISDSLIEEIKSRYSLSAEDLYGALNDTKNQIHENINLLRYQVQRFEKRPCLEYMIVNILDHCNLRCKGCDHFACIADEKFYPYEEIHKDIARMAEIFDGDYIMKIAVMGGEPLLHPDLKRILADVRHYFPHTIIRLSTNGLLLLRQDEDFWKVCRDNDVTIVNTKYPINLDFEGMKEKARQENVKFEYFEGSGDGIVKRSFKKIINLKGDSDPVESFSRCHISNYGNFLLEGKFYGCPFSSQSQRIFNKKFNQNLRMTAEDYLDIYKVNTKEEFFEFAARPRYYCRYCQGLSELFPWERTKGDISEWICEGDCNPMYGHRR